MGRKKRPEGTRAPNGASTIYLGKDGKWHGRVTMGVRDDGKPDRRHIERKTEADVIRAVRELEQQRESGRVRKPGRAWTVAKWLTHWVENIAAYGEAKHLGSNGPTSTFNGGTDASRQASVGMSRQRSAHSDR
jgi:hypothetical protein